MSATETVDMRLARLEEEIRLIRDQQEIYEVLMRYCRGADRGDTSLIASTQRLDPTHPTYDAAFEADAIVDRLTATTKRTTHFFGNVLIGVRGDRAWSESYFFTFQLVDQQATEVLRCITARYLHHFDRLDGAWFVTSKDVVHEWNRVDEIKEHAPGAEGWAYGLRSEDDPSYTWCAS